jgi:hypothetical protein
VISRYIYGQFMDSQSFVMHAAVGEANASPITIIRNWKPKTSKWRESCCQT